MIDLRCTKVTNPTTATAHLDLHGHEATKLVQRSGCYDLVASQPATGMCQKTEVNAITRTFSVYTARLPSETSICILFTTPHATLSTKFICSQDFLELRPLRVPRTHLHVEVPMVRMAFKCQWPEPSCASNQLKPRGPWPEPPKMGQSPPATHLHAVQAPGCTTSDLFCHKLLDAIGSL